MFYSHISYISYASNTSGVFSLRAMLAKSLTRAAKRGTAISGFFIAIARKSRQSSFLSLPSRTPADVNGTCSVASQ